MVKFFIPAIKAYPRVVSASIKSRWMSLLFLLPLLVYFIVRMFETEITYFIIPYFPVEEDKSFGFYKDFVRLCSNEMLWLSLFLIMAWTAYIYFPVADAFRRVENHVLRHAALYPTVVIGVTFLGSVLIAFVILQGFANSADEYVYLYQAETMGQGRLWNEAHPLEEFFLFSHIPQKDGISIGRFPPGWPLLLTLPFLVGVSPIWLNPLVAAAALFLFYSFATRYYGQRVAWWSLLAVACTSFFLFNAASFFSHAACLLMVTGFIYCLYLYLEKGRMSYVLAAGVCLGMTMITRYYNAVLLMIPVLVFLFHKQGWKSIRPLVLIGAGTVPFMAFLFWYDYSVTGNGFLPVTVWTDPREGLGFGVRGYTPLEGIEHFVRRFFLFLYWSSPALLLLYAIFLFQKVRNKTQRFLHPEDYYLIMLVIGYYFYYHIGGNQYGPRFWFEGTPFLTLFVVKKVADSKARWTWALFAAGLVYGIVKMPYIIERESRVVAERVDLYTAVEKAAISNAVVIVSTHTGIIRPMGQMDLTRNGLDYNNSVIYAHDLNARNRELLNFYPERNFYKYVKDPEAVEGKLIKLR